MGIRNKFILSAVNSVRKRPAPSDRSAPDEWVRRQLPDEHVVAVDGSSMQYLVLRRDGALALRLFTLDYRDAWSVRSFIDRFARALLEAADEVVPQSPRFWFFEGNAIPRPGAPQRNTARTRSKNFNECVRRLLRSRRQISRKRVTSRRGAGQWAAKSVPRLPWEMTALLAARMDKLLETVYMHETREVDEQIARFVQEEPQPVVVLGTDTDYLALTGAHALLVPSRRYRSYTRKTDLLERLQLTDVQLFSLYGMSGCDNVSLAGARTNIRGALSMVAQYPNAEEPAQMNASAVFRNLANRIMADIQQLWTAYRSSSFRELYNDQQPVGPPEGTAQDVDFL